MHAAGAVERFSDPPNDIAHWRVPRCVRAVNPPSPRPPLPRGATQSAMTLQVLCSFLQFIVVAARLPACLAHCAASINEFCGLCPSHALLESRCKWEARQAGRKAGG